MPRRHLRRARPTRHHAAVDPPVACASCHMPTRTYMVVDRRHDHSFRVPRPDLSAKLGTPNACNDCHADKSAAWAAAAVERWYGPEREGFQNYAEAFQAAWTDQADAAKLLAAVAADKNAPAFARASALTELAPHLSSATIDLAREALSDPDPMVRIGALDMLAGAPAAEIWPLASPLSPTKAAACASAPPRSWPRCPPRTSPPPTAKISNARRPNSSPLSDSMPIARNHARRSAPSSPSAAVSPMPKPNTRRRCDLSPHYAPAAANLADLYRQLGRDADGEQVLRAALIVSPQDAGLHHALGLTLVRLSSETKRSTNCAAPPNSIPARPDTPMSTPSPCIRSAAAPTPWPSSRTIWRAIPTIATRRRRSSLQPRCGIVHRA